MEKMHWNICFSFTKNGTEAHVTFNSNVLRMPLPGQTSVILMSLNNVCYSGPGGLYARLCINCI